MTSPAFPSPGEGRGGIFQYTVHMRTLIISDEEMLAYLWREKVVIFRKEEGVQLFKVRIIHVIRYSLVKLSDLIENQCLV
jgi:hypothetical protein